MDDVKRGERKILDDVPEKQVKATLDMEVNARGTNLSGGLLQSIALARVYVRKEAKIVILDEVIGHMDAFKKRSIVLPYLFDFIERNNMTLIIIFHDMVCLSSLFPPC